MSPHPSLPLFKEKTLSGLNCLVSCHQFEEGGIALASYNRCFFYMWIYEFLLCSPASEELPEIYNINQQVFFYHSSFIYFLFNGRSVLYYCSQPLEGDIDASAFSLGCIHLNVTLTKLSCFIVFK